MTGPGWFNRPDRQWRAVRETPLAGLAQALVRHDGCYPLLLELGWSDEQRCPALTDCGFDNQNGWHWLDVTVPDELLPAWLEPKKQQQVRTALQTRLVYFKPKGDSVRVWWKSPTNIGVRPAKKKR